MRLLLERGFQVRGGRVVSGGIEIPHSHVARELGVDRRVVDAACNRIEGDEILRGVFRGIRSIPFLRDVAFLLGLGVIVITPEDASSRGLLGRVAMEVARFGLSIRQAVSDDPYLSENPLLTIVTEGEVPEELIGSLRKIEGVRSITVF